MIIIVAGLLVAIALIGLVIIPRLIKYTFAAIVAVLVFAIWLYLVICEIVGWLLVSFGASLRSNRWTRLTEPDMHLSLGFARAFRKAVHAAGHPDPEQEPRTAHREQSGHRR